MLVKSYKRLWLMKAELKKLEILKSPIKNLIVQFMCSGVIPIVRTMKVKMFIPLNLCGPLMINLAFAVLLSRFIKIGKKDLLLMYPSVRIFDELYKNVYIKMSHVIPPLEELKQRAYCKFHNTFSHATNDCNVLRRQIQSAVNEGRIIVPQMKVDQNPFPAHTHELNKKKKKNQKNQAEVTKKNIIIGEERSEPSKSHHEAPAKKVPEDS